MEKYKSKSIIGNPSVKVIFLKTGVGYEKKVYEAFKKFLNRNDTQEIKNWWAYKLFGEYDLCFIIKKESINQDLSYAGTITGIIYATEMLCYLWGEGQESRFNQNYLKQALIGISILKLKPACLKEKNIKIEHELSNFLDKYPNFFCLGSFGWGEFVLMYPCNTVKEIYDPFLENIFSIYLKDNGKKIGLFLKTFTLVGVNYNILSPLDCSVLKKEENLITDEIYPSLSVSCRPSEIKTIMKSLQSIMKLNAVSKLSLGIFDFSVEIKNGNWGDFIEQLIRFRERHKESVFKTSAQISGFDYPLPFNRAWQFNPFYIPFRSDEAKKLEKLGHPAQESILSTIYTFN